jgi:hypothetical protein
MDNRTTTPISSTSVTLDADLYLSFFPVQSMSPQVATAVELKENSCTVEQSSALMLTGTPHRGCAIMPDCACK